MEEIRRGDDLEKDEGRSRLTFRTPFKCFFVLQCLYLRTVSHFCGHKVTVCDATSIINPCFQELMTAWRENHSWAWNFSYPFSPPRWNSCSKVWQKALYLWVCEVSRRTRGHGACGRGGNVTGVASGKLRALPHLSALWEFEARDHIVDSITPSDKAILQVTWFIWFLGIDENSLILETGKWRNSARKLGLDLPALVGAPLSEQRLVSPSLSSELELMQLSQPRTPFQPSSAKALLCYKTWLLRHLLRKAFHLVVSGQSLLSPYPYSVLLYSSCNAHFILPSLLCIFVSSAYDPPSR